MILHPRWILLLFVAVGLAALAVSMGGGCADDAGDAPAGHTDHGDANCPEHQDSAAGEVRQDDDDWLAAQLARAANVNAPLLPGERRADIIYSGGLYGMIESCGCAGNPNGGMAKELTVVEHRRNSGIPTIYVQPGKLFSFEPRPLKRPFVARAARRMGWDAIGLGSHELVAGVEPLQKLADRHNLPLVSANVLDLQGRPVAKPYIIRDLDGIRVGIFSLLGDEQYLFVQREFLDHVQVVPPLEAAGQVLGELSGKVDYIIVLSQQAPHLDRQLALKFPQINLIVGGNESRMINIPVREGSTLIVNAGVNGSFSGVVRLAIDPSRHVRVLGHEFLNAAAAVPRHPEMQAIYKAYLKESKEKPLDEGGQDPLPPIYQPSSACQPCHREIYAQYQKTAHASAWQTLVKAGRADNPECSYCHAMGLGRKSGFQSIEKTPELANVSCQACHLVASDHNLRGIKPDLEYATSQRTCEHCHTPVTSPNFDFWGGAAKVDHSDVKQKSNDPPPGYEPRLIEPVVPPKPAPQAPAEN